MGFSPQTSIIPLPRSRQSRAAESRRAFLALALCLSAPLLTGCAAISMPLSMWGSSSNEPPPGDITGSIPNKPAVAATVPHPTVAEPSPESDADVIRRTVAAARLDGQPVAWKNDASGNSGTLARIVATKAVNGAPCRDFETTLVTLDGVRLYRGRACMGYAGPWDLLGFDPVDPARAG